MIAGCLWEVVACESLDHSVSKFCLITLRQLQRLTQDERDLPEMRDPGNEVARAVFIQLLFWYFAV